MNLILKLFAGFRLYFGAKTCIHKPWIFNSLDL